MNSTKEQRQAQQERDLARKLREEKAREGRSQPHQPAVQASKKKSATHHLVSTHDVNRATGLHHSTRVVAPPTHEGDERFDYTTITGGGSGTYSVYFGNGTSSNSFYVQIDGSSAPPPYPVPSDFTPTAQYGTILIAPCPEAPLAPVAICNSGLADANIISTPPAGWTSFGIAQSSPWGTFGGSTNGLNESPAIASGFDFTGPLHAVLNSGSDTFKLVDFVGYIPWQSIDPVNSGLFEPVRTASQPYETLAGLAMRFLKGGVRVIVSVPFGQSATVKARGAGEYLPWMDKDGLSNTDLFGNTLAGGDLLDYPTRPANNLVLESLGAPVAAATLSNPFTFDNTLIVEQVINGPAEIEVYLPMVRNYGVWQESLDIAAFGLILNQSLNFPSEDSECVPVGNVLTAFLTGQPVCEVCTSAPPTSPVTVVVKWEATYAIRVDSAYPLAKSVSRRVGYWDDEGVNDMPNSCGVAYGTDSAVGDRAVRDYIDRCVASSRKRLSDREIMHVIDLIDYHDVDPADAAIGDSVSTGEGSIVAIQHHLIPGVAADPASGAGLFAKAKAMASNAASGLLGKAADMAMNKGSEVLSAVAPMAKQAMHGALGMGVNALSNAIGLGDAGSSFLSLLDLLF